MTIYSWWPREPKPGNFGDILTPYLVKKLTGQSPEYANIKELPYRNNNLLAVGSIIKFAAPNMHVWGVRIDANGG